MLARKQCPAYGRSDFNGCPGDNAQSMVMAEMPVQTATKVRKSSSETVIFIWFGIYFSMNMLKVK
jgi:hypothetical protein